MKFFVPLKDRTPNIALREHNENVIDNRHLLKKPHILKSASTAICSDCVGQNARKGHFFVYNDHSAGHWYHACKSIYEGAFPRAVWANNPSNLRFFNRN